VKIDLLNLLKSHGTRASGCAATLPKAMFGVVRIEMCSNSALDDRSILLVEDDDVFRGRLAQALRNRGFSVSEAADLTGASSSIQKQIFKFAVVDLRLPGGSGLEIVRELGESDGRTHTIVLTGFGSIATALAALRLGAADYLTKPATIEQICSALIPRRQALSNEVTALVESVPSAARLLGIHRRSLQRKLAKFPSRR